MESPITFFRIDGVALIAAAMRDSQARPMEYLVAKFDEDRGVLGLRCVLRGAAEISAAGTISDRGGEALAIDSAISTGASVAQTDFRHGG